MFSSCPITSPGGWGSQKPPPGVPINRSHPLARELRLFVPLNEGSGLAVSAIHQPYVGTMTGAVWSPTVRGVAVKTTEAPQYIKFPADVRLGQLAGDIPWTILVSVRITAITIYAGIVAYRTTATLGMWQMYIHEDVFCWGWRNPSNTDNLYVNWLSWGYALNAEHTIVLTRNPGGIYTLWCNGVSYGTRTNANVPTAGSHQLFVSALGGNALAYATSGEYRHFGIWDRCLSASEIAHITAQPYCMFESAGEPFGLDSALARPRIDGSLVSDAPLLGAMA